MDCKSRSTTNHIMKDLICNCQDYSFYQVVNLLTQYSQKLSSEQDRKFNTINIQFSVNPGLYHNKSDVESVSVERGDDHVIAKVVINFIGLYGSVSPLPAFYSEQVIQANIDDEHTRQFMDLFNHRIVSMVFQSWQKYRYYQIFKTGNKDDFSSWMFAFAGLYHRDKKINLREEHDIDWNRLLPFLGMLSMRCHSATVIETILKYYFKHDAIKIISNVKRFVEINTDQQNRLGMQCHSINNDCVIGDRVEDRNGKFRVHISQLSYKQFKMFLPDGKFNKPLMKIIKLLLRDQLDYDVELHLLKPETPRLQLKSSQDEKLGWSSWLGMYEQNQQTVIIAGGRA